MSDQDERTNAGNPSGTRHRERMYRELLDSFDEELEMEFDDERLSTLIAEISANRPNPTRYVLN